MSTQDKAAVQADCLMRFVSLVATESHFTAAATVTRLEFQASHASEPEAAFIRAGIALINSKWPPG